ncbi:MAG: hypothetical protein KKB70_11865 [Proteobacteria bacterium]|nr:hypothetical protein [Pseudomonadota bacterium]MBU1612325.1 hypothetical protein [Pseudomonadota bacterium]
MKVMLLVMSFMLALTVFASFASNTAADRERMAARVELAKGYADGQPLERIEQFEVKDFEPDELFIDLDGNLATTLAIGSLAK